MDIMRIIIFGFFLFFPESIFALKPKEDSTKIKNLGIAFNSFNKQATFVGLEYNSKNKPKNIYGIGLGVGVSFYYFRKVSNIQKNLTIGLPFRFYRNTYTFETGSSDNRNGRILYEIGPQLGLQFDLGKKKFLKLRLNYTPLDLIRAKDLDNKRYFIKDFHKIGFGIVFNLI